MLHYLKHVVHNVIPLALANLTKSVLTFMGEQLVTLLHTSLDDLNHHELNLVSLDAKLVRQKVTHTPPPM